MPTAVGDVAPASAGEHVHVPSMSVRERHTLRIRASHRGATMTGDRDLDAFRKEYGLDGAFREAVKRWRETKHHQASAIGTRGPAVTALVERFRRDLEDHLVRHHQADRQLSRAWREVKRPRRGTKRAAALKRDARERRRDKTWQAFERARPSVSPCFHLGTSTPTTN